MDDKSQIKTALTQYLENNNSKIYFDPAVFDYILEKSKEFNSKTSGIDAAFSLLNSAINKLTSVKLTEEIDELENKIGIIEQTLINGVANNDLDKVNELTRNLLKNREKVVSINQKTSKIQKMEVLNQKLKKRCYQIAQPGVDLNQNSRLAREWIELHARMNFISEFINKERIKLGLPCSLNNELIDMIIKEKGKEKVKEKVKEKEKGSSKIVEPLPLKAEDNSWLIRMLDNLI